MAGVVLVEGRSDEAAVRALAARLGRSVEVVVLGGAGGVARVLAGVGGAVVALCDAGEAPAFRRHLARAGRADVPLFVCDADLEDELIRALGVPAVEAVVAAQGELRSLATFRRQPAQQGRPPEAQLRRFLGTRSGRKIHYGRVLVDALPLDHVPAPLAGVLASV